MNNDQNITNPTTEQVESKIPNPTGKGGFAEHPEHINRDGLNRKTWTFAGLLENGMYDDIKLKEGGTIKAREAIIKRVIGMAASGDLRAIQIVMERIDGKPQQNIDITTMGGVVSPKIVIDTQRDNVVSLAGDKKV